MSDKITMNVQLKTDGDGFISQECPNCEKRFKIRYGEGSDQPLSVCPYCGHEGRNCWWTKEQVDYLGKVVIQETIEPKLEKMAKEVNRNTRKGGFITMSMNFKRSRKAIPPEEPEDNWGTTLFDCCNETIRHDSSKSTLYCVICGIKQSVE